MNTSINMKRIKELVFWTTNESWEEFIIKCWNTNYEIFLGQHCIKVVGCHHVRRHGKPYHKILKKNTKIQTFLTLDTASHIFGQDSVPDLQYVGDKARNP